MVWFDCKTSGSANGNFYLLTSFDIIDGGIRNMNGYNLNGLQGKENVSDFGGVPVTAGEKYWIFMENLGNTSVTVNIRGNLYSTATERELSEGTSKWTIASGCTRSNDPKTTNIYYKIKPSKTGYISVGLNAYGAGKSYGKVTLYNKSKKKVSNSVNFVSGYSGTDGKVYFGVTKGNTYYLRVTNVSDKNYLSYKYGIRYSVIAATDRAIGTKSSAKTLTRKADATKTLFRANGSTATDWYKFKVTAKRKTQVKIDTSYIKSGNVTVTLYHGSKQFYKKTIKPEYDGNLITISTTTSSKANTGTYYVKVVKSENASGLYKIRYVQ